MVLLTLEQKPASLDSLSEQSGLARETVRRVLSILKVKGLIEESDIPESLDEDD